MHLGDQLRFIHHGDERQRQQVSKLFRDFCIDKVRGAVTLMQTILPVCVQDAVLLRLDVPALPIFTKNTGEEAYA